MSRSIRINSGQKIYFNNTEVDDVYYNNEHIFPTPYFVSNDGTDDVSVSGDINNPFQTLFPGQELQIKTQYILEQVLMNLMKKK